MQQALDYAEHCSNDNPHGKGVWIGLAVVLKSNDDLIGDCAFIIDDDTAEIGANISTDYQHQGYGQETVRMLIDNCFQDQEVKEVSGIVDSQNTASIHMLEGVGMKRVTSFENQIVCKGIVSIEHKYAIDRSDFVNNK